MKKIILLFFAVGVLGCSRQGALDDFLVLGGTNMAQIDQYFDLSDQQHKALEKDTEDDLDHLRKERFKSFAKTLRDIDRSAQSPSNTKVLSTGYARLKQHYEESSAYFRNAGTKLVASLSEKQILNFKGKVQGEINSMKSSMNGTSNVLDDDLLNTYEQALEYWFGDLTTEQKQSLVQFSHEHPYPWKEKIKNKEAILNKFMNVEGDSQKRREFSAEFIVNYDRMRTPEYATAMDSYEKNFQNYLDGFWN